MIVRELSRNHGLLKYTHVTFLFVVSGRKLNRFLQGFKAIKTQPFVDRFLCSYKHVFVDVSASDVLQLLK